MYCESSDGREVVTYLKTLDKMLVIYDTNEDEYLDKYFTLVSMKEAVQFKTKEDAIKFIIGNYEILEIYADED